MAEEKVTTKTKDEQPRHQQKIPETAGAHEHGSGTVHGQAGDGRDSIESAQGANIFRKSFRIQERMTDDGLRYSEGNNDHRKNHIDKKEAAYFGLGIEQGVS